MGYDVHITRAGNWVHSDDAPITLEEWTAYVGRDPEMRPDGFADAAVGDGDTLRYESPGLAVWIAYSGHGRDGNMAWFDHCDSRVVVKNPDEEMLEKMRAIARSLDARVQGDDGEFYDERPGQPESPAADPVPPAADSGSWWRKLLGN